jgi:glutathione S-transferase
MYTLYYSSGAASMVVHQALLELGLPYALHELDFATRAQCAPDFLAINPAGRVPALVCPEGTVLVESAAVLMNLADRHPDAAQAPLHGDPDRAKWIEWITFMSVNFGSAYRLWFYPQELGFDAYPAALAKQVSDRVEGLWERVNTHLEAHGPYLLGERFSSADLMLTMYMRWSRRMPRPAQSWPAVARLAALVTARPSWQRMYELEGLVEWPAPAAA